jgi:phage terminase small subunit
MADLTAKQQRFVDEYLIDLNAKQAAIRAGYSDKTAEVQASRLLSYAKIKQAIIEATKEMTERVHIDQDWVLARLKLISDRCVQETPVYDKDGNETGEYRFDANGANRATELLGKHLAMFTDRSEITGKDGGPLQVKLENFFEKST